jgi:hypothetical protein
VPREFDWPLLETQAEDISVFKELKGKHAGICLYN